MNEFHWTSVILVSLRYYVLNNNNFYNIVNSFFLK